MHCRASRSGDELGMRNGMVIYKGPPHVRCVMRFQAVILTLSAAALARPMLPGSSFELYLHGDEVGQYMRSYGLLYTNMAMSALVSTAFPN